MVIISSMIISMIMIMSGFGRHLLSRGQANGTHTILYYAVILSDIMCVYIYIYIYVHTYVLYIYIHMCVYIYIYIYDTDTQAMVITNNVEATNSC